MRLALDWRTLEYKPSERPRFPSLELLKNVERTAERIPQLLAGDPKKDKAGAFYWPMLTPLYT